VGNDRKPADQPDKIVDGAEDDTKEHKPFEFVERPRVEPDVYISRPELGRNPPQSRADPGRRRS
jgi:hypothetical protein